jgi:hypothetical protein
MKEVVRKLLVVVLAFSKNTVCFLTKILKYPARFVKFIA